MMIAVPQRLFRLLDVIHRSRDAFVFVAVDLYSPSNNCSYVQTAVQISWLKKTTKKQQKKQKPIVFMLDCLLWFMSLTSLDNMGCHSNDVPVHQRQSSVHNVKRVKGSLHYWCTGTQACTFAETDTHSPSCVHTSGHSGNALLSPTPSCVAGLFVSVGWIIDVCWASLYLQVLLCVYH